MHEKHHIIIPFPNPLPVEQAVQALKASLLEYTTVTADTPVEKPGTLAVFRQNIPALDPLKWLSAQSLFPRIFWMNRERDDMTAAIGAADTITHEEAASNEENFRRLGTAMAGKSPMPGISEDSASTAAKPETPHGKRSRHSPSRSLSFSSPERVPCIPSHATSGSQRLTEQKLPSTGPSKRSTSCSLLPRNQIMSSPLCSQSPITPQEMAG